MEDIYKILEDIRPEFNFRESDNYIDDGFLDSFDIITLIDEIEELFNIKIDGLEIIPENFESVTKILQLIMRSGGNIG